MGSVKFKTGFNLTPVSLHLSDYSTILMTYTNCYATFVRWLHAVLRQNMLAWSWSLLQITWAAFWRLVNTFLILIMAFVHWLLLSSDKTCLLGAGHYIKSFGQLFENLRIPSHFDNVVSVTLFMFGGSLKLTLHFSVVQVVLAQMEFFKK